MHVSNANTKWMIESDYLQSSSHIRMRFSRLGGRHHRWCNLLSKFEIQTKNQMLWKMSRLTAYCADKPHPFGKCANVSTIDFYYQNSFQEERMKTKWNWKIVICLGRALAPQKCSIGPQSCISEKKNVFIYTPTHTHRADNKQICAVARFTAFLRSRIYCAHTHAIATSK